MGVLVSGVCYSDISVGLSVLASTFTPVSVATPDGLMTYTKLYTGEEGMFSVYTFLEGALIGVRSEQALLMSCDPAESVYDGMALGWGVAAVVFAAALVMVLKRGLR